MVKQYAMVIDSTRCIDCKACMVACKVANDVSDGHWRNWIKQERPDVAAGARGKTSFQPGACMHCDVPTCVQACPTGATWKDEATGIVEVDPKLCIGCGNCIPACPYGARYRDPVDRKVDKCNYCPERRAAGLPPACVDTCPTKARVFGDINDPKSEAARLLKENKGRIVQVVNRKTNTNPNMYYIGKTAPVDWAEEAVIPASMVAMKQSAPVVKTLVGLSGLGVLAMLGRQLFAGSGKDEEGSHD